MKNKIVATGLLLCLLASVSGCVVTPARPVYYAPAPVHVVYWR